MAIAALVFGILGIILFWVPFVDIVTLILCIAGIVLSALGMKKAKANGQGTGVAVAALVLCIIGTVFCIIGACACSCPYICAGCIANDVANSLGSTADMADLMNSLM